MSEAGTPQPCPHCWSAPVESLKLPFLAQAQALRQGCPQPLDPKLPHFKPQNCRNLAVLHLPSKTSCFVSAKTEQIPVSLTNSFEVQVFLDIRIETDSPTHIT